MQLSLRQSDCIYRGRLSDVYPRRSSDFRENNFPKVGLRTRSTPRGPVTPRPHEKCSPGRTRHFWDYLLILVGQLGKGPQVPSLKTVLGTYLVGRGAPSKLGREMPRSGRAKCIFFFWDSRGENESSEALLTSQRKSYTELLSEIST